MTLSLWGGGGNPNTNCSRHFHFFCSWNFSRRGERGWSQYKTCEALLHLNLGIMNMFWGIWIYVSIFIQVQHVKVPSLLHFLTCIDAQASEILSDLFLDRLIWGQALNKLITFIIELLEIDLLPKGKCKTLFYVLCEVWHHRQCMLIFIST